MHTQNTPIEALAPAAPKPRTNVTKDEQKRMKKFAVKYMRQNPKTTVMELAEIVAKKFNVTLL